MICAAEGCQRNVERRAWCKGHYERWRLGTDINRPITYRGDPVRWLRANVCHIGDACLTWPFAKDTAGYGLVHFDGQHRGAHRVMCILAFGPAPTETHWAAHSCGKGNEACVNPRHLRWATPAENQADKWGHGTMLVGAKHGRSKLSEADAIEIVRLRDYLLQREIGELFGIGQSHVGRILRGDNWGHLCQRL